VITLNIPTLTGIKNKRR